MVDTEAVREYISTLPDVALARTYKYMCSNPGQEIITQDIKELLWLVGSAQRPKSAPNP